MSDCNNNCEAVAGLNEAAANIVQYRNLINSWLNGAANATVNVAGVNTPTLLKLVTDLRTRINQMPQSILQQNGGIAIDGNGKLYINFATMPDSILYGLLQKIVQPGGGLAFDEQGQMFVNFASMPTDKFDDMLKSLTVPIWLKAHLHLYVNNNGVDDEEDKTRGLSETKPFETIQYAINFACDYYNLSTFNVYIHLAPGVYQLTSPLRLGGYTTNTGSIYIQGANPDSNGVMTSWLKVTDTALANLNNSVIYSLEKIGYDINMTKNMADHTALLAANAGTLYLNGFQFKITVSNFDSSQSAKDARVIYSSSGGKVVLRNFVDADCKVDVYGNNEDIYIKTISGFLNAYTDGRIRFEGANTDEKSEIVCNSRFATFAVCSGKITTNAAYGTRLLSFTGNNEGKKYSASAGGGISTSNSKGINKENFFPGTIAGTVEASTYSWIS